MTPVRFKFMTPEGDPLANTAFQIELPCPGYHVEPSGVVLPRVVEAITDVDGEALIELWPLTNPYEVTAYDPVAKSELFYKFIVPVLPEGETELRLQDIIVTGTLVSQSTDPDILAQMTDKYVATLAVANTILTNLNTGQDAADTAVAAADTAVAAADAAEISATTANNAALSANTSAGQASSFADAAAVAQAAAESATLSGRLIDIQVFNIVGSHTWTKPSGLTAGAVCEVEIIGGGGRGGGSNAASAGQISLGSPGGQGAYFKGRILASLLAATEDVVVGAGGIGATGTQASASIFCTGGDAGYVHAFAGPYGDSLVSGTTVAGVRAPGFNTALIGTPGNWLIINKPSTGYAPAAFRLSGTQYIQHPGAASQFGPGGAEVVTIYSEARNGYNGSGYGSGGSGAVSINSGAAAAGGNGANGVVIVRTYS